MRILLSGMVAGDPHQGGASWAILQYFFGLRALGHDVMLLEPVNEISPETAGYFRREIVQRFGLEQRAALLARGTRQTFGVDYPGLRRFAAGAELLLNVSGMLRDDDLRRQPVQVYLDLDPVFNQLWHEEGLDVGLDGHDRYVTVGQALGEPSCPVPTCGRQWIKTLPPVHLDAWPAREEIAWPAFTAVGNWRAYGSIVHGGVQYGQKAHSVRALADLPELSSQPILLAYAIDPGEGPDLELLARHSWKLGDPRRLAGDPAAYARFVSGSMAELGIAKSGYVAARCGWFSDRSACYLASGRPVLAQDTGFGDRLPVGEGLLAFSTAEQAAAGAETIAGGYAVHARAARGLAEEVFNARVVLSGLLDRIGAAA